MSCEGKKEAQAQDQTIREKNMNATPAPAHPSTTNEKENMKDQLISHCDNLVAQWEATPADARKFIEYETIEVMDLVVNGAWVGALLTLEYGGRTTTLDTYQGKLEAHSNGTTVTRNVVVDADILDELESHFSASIA